MTDAAVPGAGSVDPSSRDRLVFRGGFLVVPRDQFEQVPAIDHWRNVELGGTLVAHDPIALASIADGRFGRMVLVGHAFDPYGGLSCSADVVRHLVELEPDDLLDALDQLSGRFVLVGQDETRGTWIVSDASASRSVAHTIAPGTAAASSHATLLGELLGLKRSVTSREVLTAARRAKTSRVTHLPGRLTAIDGVRSLSPNHRLWLSDGSIERVFPRRRRQRSWRSAAVITETAEVLTRSMDLLTRERPARISLTAGLDSRTTFAASRHCLDRIEAFSYVNTESPNATHLVDVRIAEELSRRAGVPHALVDLGETTDNPGSKVFRSAWLRNLGVARGLETLNREFVRSWPRGVVHVRSNVAEAVQGFYTTRVGDPPSAEELARRWHPLGAHPDAVAAIDELLIVYGLTGRRVKGYDVRDLFYWEHRLPQWYAWLCLESDMSHDTFCPFGNRRLLTRILSLSRRDQVQKVAFLGSIERLWPELLDLPINPVTWPAP